MDGNKKKALFVLIALICMTVGNWVCFILILDAAETNPPGPDTSYCHQMLVETPPPPPGRPGMPGMPGGGGPSRQDTIEAKYFVEYLLLQIQKRLETVAEKPRASEIQNVVQQARDAIRKGVVSIQLKANPAFPYFFVFAGRQRITHEDPSGNMGRIKIAVGPAFQDYFFRDPLYDEGDLLRILQNVVSIDDSLTRNEKNPRMTVEDTQRAFEVRALYWSLVANDDAQKKDLRILRAVQALALKETDVQAWNQAIEEAILIRFDTLRRFETLTASFDSGPIRLDDAFVTKIEKELLPFAKEIKDLLTKRIRQLNPGTKLGEDPLGTGKKPDALIWNSAMIGFLKRDLRIIHTFILKATEFYENQFLGRMLKLATILQNGDVGELTVAEKKIKEKLLEFQKTLKEIEGYFGSMKDGKKLATIIPLFQLHDGYFLTDERVNPERDSLIAEYEAWRKRNTFRFIADEGGIVHLDPMDQFIPVAATAEVDSFSILKAVADQCGGTGHCPNVLNDNAQDPLLGLVALSAPETGESSSTPSPWGNKTPDILIGAAIRGLTETVPREETPVDVATQKNHSVVILASQEIIDERNLNQPPAVDALVRIAFGTSVKNVGPTSYRIPDPTDAKKSMLLSIEVQAVTADTLATTLQKNSAQVVIALDRSTDPKNQIILLPHFTALWRGIKDSKEGLELPMPSFGGETPPGTGSAAGAADPAEVEELRARIAGLEEALGQLLEQRSTEEPKPKRGGRRRGGEESPPPEPELH